MQYSTGIPGENTFFITRYIDTVVNNKISKTEKNLFKLDHQSVLVQHRWMFLAHLNAHYTKRPTVEH